MNELKIIQTSVDVKIDLRIYSKTQCVILRMIVPIYNILNLIKLEIICSQNI